MPVNSDPNVHLNHNSDAKNRKRHVFHKLFTGFCKPSKVLNDVVLMEQPKQLKHDHDDHPSRDDGHDNDDHETERISETIEGTPVIVGEVEPPLLMSEPVRDRSSLTLSSPTIAASSPLRAAMPLVRRVSFQDQTSSKRIMTNEQDAHDRIKISFDQTNSPNEVTIPSRLTMTNILAMVIVLLIALTTAGSCLRMLPNGATILQNESIHIPSLSLKGNTSLFLGQNSDSLDIVQAYPAAIADRDADPTFATSGSDEEDQVEESVVMKGDGAEACAVDTPSHQPDLRVEESLVMEDKVPEVPATESIPSQSLFEQDEESLVRSKTVMDLSSIETTPLESTDEDVVDVDDFTYIVERDNAEQIDDDVPDADEIRCKDVTVDTNDPLTDAALVSEVDPTLATNDSDEKEQTDESVAMEEKGSEVTALDEAGPSHQPDTRVEESLVMENEVPEVSAIEATSPQLPYEQGGESLVMEQAVPELSAIDDTTPQSTDEEVVNVDGFTDIVERDPAEQVDDDVSEVDATQYKDVTVDTNDPSTDDAFVSEQGHGMVSSASISLQTTEQVIEATTAGKEHADDEHTGLMSDKRDTEEGEPFAFQESAEHIEQEQSSDVAFNEDNKVEEISDAVTAESKIAHVATAKDETESGGTRVVVIENSAAVQQAEHGERVLASAFIEVTDGRRKDSAVVNPEVGESGNTSEKQIPSLQAWILCSNISMAVAILMSIVAAWAGGEKAPADRFDRKTWRKLKKKEHRRKKRVSA